MNQSPSVLVDSDLKHQIGKGRDGGMGAGEGRVTTRPIASAANDGVGVGDSLTYRKSG